jgi:hypothetical protein
MTKITDLFDRYDGYLPEFKTKEPVSADRVAEITLEKVRNAAPAIIPQKSPKKLSRTVLIAAAVTAVLIVSALAASGLYFSEIPEGLRLWFGIEDGAVPGYVKYDVVNISDGASIADTDHDGDGELYISAGKGTTVRGGNLLTAYITVRTVTRGQYENYVWRAQVDGEENWIAAEPDSQGGDHNAYHDDEVTGPWVTLRLSFILDGDETDTLHVTLCGGYESADEKTFNVERTGIFTVAPGEPSPTVTVTFGDGIPFTNKDTGETGYITGADIMADRMIWYYRADGLYDISRDVYEDPGGKKSKEDWIAANDKLMAWVNSYERAMRGAALNFSDGTSLDRRLGEASQFLKDDACLNIADFRDLIDMDKLESVTVAGQTFPVN